MQAGTGTGTTGSTSAMLHAPRHLPSSVRDAKPAIISALDAPWARICSVTKRVPIPSRLCALPLTPFIPETSSRSAGAGRARILFRPPCTSPADISCASCTQLGQAILTRQARMLLIARGTPILRLVALSHHAQLQYHRQYFGLSHHEIESAKRHGASDSLPVCDSTRSLSFWPSLPSNLGDRRCCAMDFSSQCNPKHGPINHPFDHSAEKARESRYRGREVWGLTISAQKNARHTLEPPSLMPVPRLTTSPGRRPVS
ncbi:hypothetical protein B0H67DRAFT_154632 [Lasiosphaeris hirsuta]|uniref:Uncharacterized protein n=1 Tax=Lasiosphaeris hirsuta TaxID=260670 RepID=A0AA40DZN2_9PEZI|nr:hypothetical protein B0H67DRAFT_154632 [Lasiosphaeris hirsuta]